MSFHIPFNLSVEHKCVCVCVFFHAMEVNGNQNFQKYIFKIFSFSFWGELSKALFCAASAFLPTLTSLSVLLLKTHDVTTTVYFIRWDAFVGCGDGYSYARFSHHHT